MVRLSIAFERLKETFPRDFIGGADDSLHVVTFIIPFAFSIGNPCAALPNVTFGQPNPGELVYLELRKELPQDFEQDMFHDMHGGVRGVAEKPIQHDTGRQAF